MKPELAPLSGLGQSTCDGHTNTHTHTCTCKYLQLFLLCSVVNLHVRHSRTKPATNLEMEKGMPS